MSSKKKGRQTWWDSEFWAVEINKKLDDIILVTYYTVYKYINGEEERMGNYSYFRRILRYRLKSDSQGKYKINDDDGKG